MEIGNYLLSLLIFLLLLVDLIFLNKISVLAAFFDFKKKHD